MEELARESIVLLAKPAECTDGPRLGSAGASFIMLKSALGAGLLNFPWAFHKAGGVSIAIGVEMMSLLFLVSGLLILAHAASASGQGTYQDVVRQVCGRVAGRLCEACFLLNLFLISVAFLVVVQDQLEKLCHSLFLMISGSTEGEMPYRWYTDQRLSLFILCLLVILPLSLPQEIGMQKYSSLLGTLTAMYLTVAVIVKYYSREDHVAPPPYAGSVNSWASAFSVMPTICFGFQCHEASVTIYSSLENKALPHWALISVVSMLFCLFIYTLTGQLPCRSASVLTLPPVGCENGDLDQCGSRNGVQHTAVALDSLCYSVVYFLSLYGLPLLTLGIFGYLTFGKDVAADILMSYPRDDLAIIFARLLFGISIITIYPITLLLGRSVIQDLLPHCWQHRAAATPPSKECGHAVLTVAWILATLLIAVCVPDISNVIGITGGISAFFIFIFPGLCLMSSMQSEPVSPSTRVILTTWGAVTLLCGVFIFGQSTTIAIMELLTRL